MYVIQYPTEVMTPDATERLREAWAKCCRSGAPLISPNTFTVTSIDVDYHGFIEDDTWDERERVESRPGWNTAIDAAGVAHVLWCE